MRIFAVLKTNMVPLVQLVRASDCGSECHGFESHRAPQKKEVERLPFFVHYAERTHGFVIDEVEMSNSEFLDEVAEPKAKNRIR